MIQNLWGCLCGHVSRHAVPRSLSGEGWVERTSGCTIHNPWGPVAPGSLCDEGCAGRIPDYTAHGIQAGMLRVAPGVPIAKSMKVKEWTLHIILGDRQLPGASAARAMLIEWQSMLLESPGAHSPSPPGLGDEAYLGRASDCHQNCWPADLRSLVGEGCTGGMDYIT